MAQRTILTKTQACWVGLESTFGTLATNMRRLYLRGAAMPLGTLTRDQLARDDASVYQHDNQSDILGLQSGAPVKLPFDCKRIIARLDKDATPPAVTDSDALSHQVVLHHAFGTSHVDAGGVIQSSATVADYTALTLDTGEGARFVAGQICIPHVAGVGHPRYVKSVVGEVVTVWPALPSLPASGQLMLNTYTFARAEAHSSSLSVQTAHTQTGATETQRQATGIAGQIAWTGEVKKLAAWAFEGALQAWADSGDLSLTVADAADDMGDAMLWNPTLLLWDNTVLTSPTATNAPKTMVAIPNTFVVVGTGGGVEGASAKVMTSGRDAPATFEIVTLFDRSYETAYEAETKYGALLYSSVGSGTAQRWAIWGAPNLSFSAKPDRTDEGGLVYSHLKFKALANANIGGSPLGASSTDFMRSPVVFAEG